MILRLVKTCEASPEQYDVLDGNNQEVGYMRLRWGYFRVQCPLGGRVVYSSGVGDAYCGLFPTEELRQLHIQKGLDAIKAELGGK